MGTIVELIILALVAYQIYDLKLVMLRNQSRLEGKLETLKSLAKEDAAHKEVVMPPVIEVQKGYGYSPNKDPDKVMGSKVFDKFFE